ncbi:CRISPR-associated helicase Cas3' [Nocardioides acrostichi]|uniref:CRISPR-associated helicase Cas3 n=1 Tax=Nocardioides acrostichi TaxID=2784339 RepID=A0A930Y8F9_9ACTN|nr:CRISPR-associated helicase Cas3' [Nocardioides acrostichi]MBF4163026.1 CRISPR-associated helicase Cas3' [Nocardioides acrostichi]
MATSPTTSDYAWSAAALSCWGKTSRFDDTSWLPTVQHLEDSAGVADRVWDWLPSRTRQHIQHSLPEGASDGRALLRWLAGVHDIGKLSPPFVAQQPALAGRAVSAGLPCSVSRDDMRFAKHASVGHVLLSRWLKDRFGARPRVAKTYAAVVGSHHGIGPDYSTVNALESGRSDLVGGATWGEVQREALDTMAEISGADAYLDAWARHPLPSSAAMLLTGAVIVSDWLASDENRFEVTPHPQPGRVEQAWTDLRLPRGWQPQRAVTSYEDRFARRFPGLGPLRPPQQLVLDAVRQLTDAIDEPRGGLVIVEAAMGSGKTEAALLAAERLAATHGCEGVFVALPTMATSNAMFDRVLAWIEHLELNASASVFLAHGKATLHDQYRGLAHIDRLSDIYDEGDSPTTGVHEWLQGRKKGVLSSMVVGTIDQVLFTGLQAKHVMLRHLALAGKVVIVDEVHAADDFMRSYLETSLAWLARYGVPVVLMSATLPRAQRQQLVDAYRRGLDAPSQPLPDASAYPLVTTATADHVRALTLPDPPRAERVVDIGVVGDDLDDLAQLLDRWLVDGGCVAVLRNTVQRAQDAARFLRERFGDEHVTLVHSRFLACHRARIEDELRQQLGPGDEHRPAMHIVVGTQVLEQSLDVDFDAMVSDLAPADLVLQRIGRLHRHERSRPPALRSARLAISGIVSWSDAGPAFVPGSRAVYGDSRLIRSAAALGLPSSTTLSSISLPDQIRETVDTAYAAEPAVPDSWLERCHKADERAASQRKQLLDRASTYRLPNPSQVTSLIGLNDQQEAESSEGSARVRDGEDGIEVIVVMRDENDELRFVDAGEKWREVRIPTFLEPPSGRVARALATYTVNLPVQLTAPRLFDQTLRELERNCWENWQQSWWLRGQLVLVLDGELSCRLAGHRLIYDFGDGLVVTKEEA